MEVALKLPDELQRIVYRHVPYNYLILSQWRCLLQKIQCEYIEAVLVEDAIDLMLI